MDPVKKNSLITAVYKIRSDYLMSDDPDVPAINPDELLVFAEIITRKILRNYYAAGKDYADLTHSYFLSDPVKRIYARTTQRHLDLAKISALGKILNRSGIIQKELYKGEYSSEDHDNCRYRLGYRHPQYKDLKHKSSAGNDIEDAFTL